MESCEISGELTSEQQLKDHFLPESAVLAHDFDLATNRVDDYVLEAMRRYLTITRESQPNIYSLSELKKVTR
jgi:hypothetical protein